jgi:prepilin-type processing-associated H-X9-DG protein
MYKIIGADQKEYGPITGEQLRHWIADGRVNAETRVQVLPDTDWRKLGEVPEFAAELGNPTQPHQPAGPPPVPKGKTSGMAITSLVLGILGLFTCGLTAIIGLILGIISMVKIKNSNGQLTGWGLGLAGTIVSGVFLLMFPIWLAMMLPAFAKAQQRAQSIQCVNNMKQLALAVVIYSGDNNDTLPPAATWCDAIHENVGSDQPFKCPQDTGDERCSYAFNAKLGGMEYDKVAPETVMIYEAAGGWNVSGGSEAMLESSRHGTKFVVAFADGSVQQLTQAQLGALRWDP